jgi:hypothetical protein
MSLFEFELHEFILHRREAGYTPLPPFSVRGLKAISMQATICARAGLCIDDGTSNAALSQGKFHCIVRHRDMSYCVCHAHMRISALKGSFHDRKPESVIQDHSQGAESRNIPRIAPPGPCADFRAARLGSPLAKGDRGGCAPASPAQDERSNHYAQSAISSLTLISG